MDNILENLFTILAVLWVISTWIIKIYKSLSQKADEQNQPKPKPRRKTEATPVAEAIKGKIDQLLKELEAAAAPQEVPAPAPIEQVLEEQTPEIFIGLSEFQDFYENVQEGITEERAQEAVEPEVEQPKKAPKARFGREAVRDAIILREMLAPELQIRY